MKPRIPTSRNTAPTSAAAFWTGVYFIVPPLTLSLRSAGCCSLRLMSASATSAAAAPNSPGASVASLRLLEAVAFHLDALLAHLVRDRLPLGLYRLADRDLLLGHSLLLHDGLLAAERQLDLLVADLAGGGRPFDALARD